MWLHDDTKANLGAKNGDDVRVFGVDLPYGKKVAISPRDDTISDLPPGTDLFQTLLKPFFLESYRPICVGDCIPLTCPGTKKRVEFQVIELDPSPWCIVEPNTLIFCNRENAIKAHDLESRRFLVFRELFFVSEAELGFILGKLFLVTEEELRKKLGTLKDIWENVKRIFVQIPCITFPMPSLSADPESWRELN